MNNEITTDVWALQTLRLVQALLGAVSANFRLVGLDHDGKLWRLVFILAEDRGEDREEIDDIGFEFEALQEKATAYEVDVSVSREPILLPLQTVRVVYRRRET